MKNAGFPRSPACVIDGNVLQIFGRYHYSDKEESLHGRGRQDDQRIPYFEALEVQNCNDIAAWASSTVLGDSHYVIRRLESNGLPMKAGFL